MPGSASAAGRLYSAALGPATATSTEYSSFTTFDPLMENPPNASVQDVPPTSVAASSSDFSMATSLAVAAASNLGPAGHPPGVGGGGASTFKPAGGHPGGGPDTSEFFPAEMAEILGSPTGSTSLSGASNGLTGSAFGPPLSLMASSDSYSDLTQTSSLHHHPGGLQPLSNASMESRGSTEDDNDDNSVGGPRGSGDTKVSGFTKAIRALNDFGSVYSFE